jgi:hypothetical protein
MVKGIRLLILLFLISLSLYGCSWGMHNAFPKSDDSKATKQIIRVGTISELWGSVPVKSLDIDASTAVFSISEEGDLICGESLPFQGKMNKDKMTIYDDAGTNLIIRNIYSNSKNLIRTVNNPIQIWSACINDRWVVWKEAKSYDGLGAEYIKIYSYNRKTKETRLVYSDENGNIAEKGYDPKLSLKDDKILMDIVSTGKQTAHNSIISRQYDLNTNSYVEIDQQFAWPLWGKDGYFGLGEDKSVKSYSMVYHLKNGIRKPLLKKSAYIYDLMTDGNTVAVTAQRFKTNDPSTEPEKRSLWLLENGKELHIVEITEKNLSEGCAWPSMSKRLIIWTSNGKGFAYDRELKEIVSLSNNGASSTADLTTDRYLLWYSPSAKDLKENTNGYSLLNIIDIRDLPDR